jgi:peptidyl-prolyl cis-trans isomerase D
MLRKLHNKKTQKKIYLILIIGVGLPFLLWGTTSSIRGRKVDTYYGKIFGKKISQSEFEDALRAVEIQARMQFGESFYELQKLLNLKNLAFQRLILLYEAKRKKIRVTDAELINSIEHNPTFQKNGKFDKNLYETIIRYEFQLQPRAFEEYFREDMILKKLSDSVTNAISLTDQEIKEAYKKENEQININYIAGLPSDFQKDITPTEEELNDYFSKNSIEFKQPLSFNLEYLSLDSQEKIKNNNFYLNKKENLEKIAKNYNLTIQETGLFGQTDPIPGIGWQQQISNSLPKLKTGDTLPVIEIDNHYYLFRLKERKEPYIPEYRDVKDKVKEVFIKNKAREIAKEKTENCLKKIKDDFAINPKEINFDKYAKEYGLKSGSTDLFKFGSYIEGIGASDKIFTIANNLKEDEFSEIIDMPSGFYIIKVKTRVPVDEKKFAEEKEKFTQKLLLQKKEEYFSKFLEEVIKKSQNP